MERKNRMSKEQFLNQFPYTANIEKIRDLLVREHHPIEEWYEGIECYRALNMLLVKVDGKFYAHG